MLNIQQRCFERNDGKYINQFLTAFSASIALFSAGLHFGWAVSSLPQLISEDYFNISENEASTIVTIGSVGHVIGGIGGSYLIDHFGRKGTILLIAVPQFLGFLLTHCSIYGTYWLYPARILGGIGEGASIAIIPAYIAEVTSPEVRGVCGTMTGLFLPTGTIVIILVGSYLKIHITALYCLMSPIVHALVFSMMPESPYYYLMKEKSEQAEHSLRILRRQTNVERELLSLTADVRRQMSERGSYKDLIAIPANRRALILVIFVRFFQQFTGCSAFSTYSQVLIKQVTNLSPIMGSVLIQCLGIAVIAPTFFLIEQLGRKMLMLIGTGFTFGLLVLLGSFFVYREKLADDVSDLDWVPLALMAFFVITFSLGSGVVVAVFISEIFSSSIKSKALGVCSIAFAGSMMASIKLYQFTSDNYSIAVPFYMFAFTTFLNILFTAFFIPETKGKTLENIQQELRN